MEDCFRWKLLAGVLAFLLAFTTFQLTLLWADSTWNYRAQETYKDEICKLWKKISEMDGKNYLCIMPRVPTLAHNIFMQEID